jgi:predicted phosphohydrolase
MVQANKKSEMCIHKNSQDEPNKEVANQEVSSKDFSKKERLKKRKPSLKITFHNPNSEEATASFLTKLLAERVAEEMGKEFRK